ncbi:MAG: heavy metal translocating P-type ATPase [Endomicrobiales bacterium]
MSLLRHQYSRQIPMIPRKETISVSGMHCSACALNIERALSSHQGIVRALVSYASGKAIVEFDEQVITLDKIEQIISETGYGVVKAEAVGLAHAEHQQQQDEIANLKKRLLVAGACIVPLIYIAMGRGTGLYAFEMSPSMIAFIEFLLCTFIMIAGALFFRRGIGGPLMHIGWDMHHLHEIFSAVTMDTLVAIGSGSAYVYSLWESLSLWFGGQQSGERLYYETAGVLITFILLGNWLSVRAKQKTSEAITKLMTLVPPTARVIRQGIEQEIPVSTIIAGDRIVIRPGERVPVDGSIVEGTSSIDQSMVTGESVPVDKGPGQSVIGGTINTSGSFVFTAQKVGADTFLARMVRLVEQAQQSRAPVQNLTDTISRYFVPFVIVLAVISAVIWLMVGQSHSFALSIFIAVIMIACPCALGLATPTAVIVGTGTAARHGILVKDFAALENLAKADTFVFDKTGTITSGKPEVTSVIVSETTSEPEFLAWVAAVENLSEHMLAKTIVKYAAGKGVAAGPATGFHAVEGFGVAAMVQDVRILVGKKDFMTNNNISVDPVIEQRARKHAVAGSTLVWVSSGDTIAGFIALADIVKPSASEAISFLKGHRAHVVMLTGDSLIVARAVGDQIGIDTVHAELLPTDKANMIDELKNQGAVVCMVGDGINDALALVSAHVGVAIGSGTDVSLEAADIVLVHSDLASIISAVKISERVMRTVKQNLFWAFCYNVIGMVVATGVLYRSTGFLLNPMIAGAAMALSSLSVVSNSLLIRRFKP